MTKWVSLFFAVLLGCCLPLTLGCGAVGQMKKAIECKKCSGSGKCQSCNGSGGVFYRCNACSGSGKCARCNGAGF
jgi:hypothetical protein